MGKLNISMHTFNIYVHLQIDQHILYIVHWDRFHQTVAYIMCFWLKNKEWKKKKKKLKLNPWQLSLSLFVIIYYLCLLTKNTHLLNVEIVEEWIKDFELKQIIGLYNGTLGYCYVLVILYNCISITWEFSIKMALF